MKILDFLKMCDCCGTDCVVYSIEDENSEYPLYEGSTYDMPWHTSLYELVDPPKDAFDENTPIQFRSDLGENHNHRPGFVILIKEEY